MEKSMTARIDEVLGEGKFGYEVVEHDYDSRTVYLRGRGIESATLESFEEMLVRNDFLPVFKHTDRDCTGEWFAQTKEIEKNDNVFCFISRQGRDC